MNQTSVSNVSFILNSKIGLLRDDTEHIINNFEIWLNQLISQTRNQSLIRKNRCEICNSTEDYFEGHHVAGRKHDHRQITACKSCHDKLTLLQKKWDVRWLESKQSENQMQAFFLNGLYDVLILKSKNSGISLYERFASFLIEDISQELKT